MRHQSVPFAVILSVLLCVAIADGSPIGPLAQKLQMTGYRTDEIRDILSGRRTLAEINADIRRKLLGLNPAPPIARRPPSEAKRHHKLLLAARPYLPAIKTAAHRHSVPSTLILAVIQVESAFNATAVSHRGAVGLMQLMPDTAEALGIGNPLDPLENISGGTRYLSYCLTRFDNTALALAAYNAGPERVSAHGGIPPLKETQAFVQRVLSYERYFRQQM